MPSSPEPAHEAFVETAAIVLHGKRYPVAFVLHRDLKIARAGVTRGVVQRLLDQPVDAGLVLVRKIVRGLDPRIRER